MPSHRALKYNDGKFYKRPKPWAARRKRDGREYFLGYYATEKEAVEAETKFDTEWEKVYGDE